MLRLFIMRNAGGSRQANAGFRWWSPSRCPPDELSRALSEKEVAMTERPTPNHAYSYSVPHNAARSVVHWLEALMRHYAGDRSGPECGPRADPGCHPLTRQVLTKPP